ncbi:MAG: DUF4388 domain-containing protein [Deltaproteobacteria bacterium]|nr:DUF4388 domain-containing protein [Deltaproteobacteria bacterium]
MQKDESSTISGVSLASFLQLLEQEQKTCTLLVANEERRGHLFLENGELIDAETAEAVGIDAAYIILAWQNPSFKMYGPRERGRRIDQSLTYVLMNAARKQDENVEGDTSQNPSASYQRQAGNNPLLTQLVDVLKKIPGIRHYFILNRQAKMIAYSEQNKKMGDFIAYCIVAAGEMRKILDTKGPHRILLTLKNGQMLLISSVAGMIFALLLNENVSADDVFEKLRLAFAAPGGR